MLFPCRVPLLGSFPVCNLARSPVFPIIPSLHPISRLLTPRCVISFSIPQYLPCMVSSPVNGVAPWSQCTEAHALYFFLLSP